jgi:CubicO group peptidase (beta-lactamase class C family)
LGINIEKNITFDSKEEQMDFYKSTSMNGWVADPAGTNTAGWGLTISPVDMAKIGQMYLNKGVWNGQRIVSEKWVTESTTEKSRWKKLDLPYGYLWWIGEKGGFAAMGDGGNIIFVSPEKNMVVAITSLFYPRAKDRIEFIEKYVYPIF